MNTLSKRKIKFIKKNRETLTTAEIAKRLGIKNSDVQEVLLGFHSPIKMSETEYGEKRDSLSRAIEYLLYALIVIAPLVYFPYIENFSNLPKATFIQAVSGVLLFLWLLNSYRTGFILLIRHPLIIASALWFIWCGVTIIWSSDKFSGIVLLTHWFSCAICFFIIVHSIKDNQIDRILLACVISGSLVSVIGLFQYIFGLSFIPQAFIPGSTFSNRNMAAQLVVLIWPMSFLLFVLCKGKKMQCVYGLSYSLMFVFILYTKTRAAWVAILVSLILLIGYVFSTGFWRELGWVFQKDKRVVFFASIIFITGMSFVPQYTSSDENILHSLFSLKNGWFQKQVAGAATKTPGDSSESEGKAHPVTPPSNASETNREIMSDEKPGIQKNGFAPEADTLKISGFSSILASVSDYRSGSAGFRLVWWENTIHMIRKHFILGTGLANWYVHYPLYNRAAKKDPIFSMERQPAFLHNDPLQLLAETSLIGIVLYLSVFFLLLLGALKGFRLSNDPRTKLRLIFMMTAVVCFFVNSLFSFPLRMTIPPFFLAVITAIIVSIEWHIRAGIKRSVIPVKKRLIIPLCVFVLASTILLVVFNFRRVQADYHFLNSMYLNNSKNWKTAKMAAEAARKNNPWRYQIWFELAKANDHLGLDNKAIDACLQALAIHPNHMNSLFKLGYLYIKKNDFEKAGYWAERGMVIEPELKEANFTMGLVREHQEKLVEAVKFYRKEIQFNPQNARAWYRLGGISAMENRMSDAREQFEKANEFSPDMKGVHFNLGVVYTALNMQDKAIDEYTREIELHPDSAEPYSNLGLIHAGRKEWGKAISIYEKALRINPDFGPAHINIAVAFYMTGDYKSAWKHSREGEKLGIPQARILIKRLREIFPEKQN